MTAFLKLLGIVAPVLITLALGFFSRRRRIFTSQQMEGMKLLVCNFTLPAVLFGAFYNASYDATILACALVVFVACLAGLGLGMLLRRALREKQELMPYLTTGFEMGMMGYALYTMIFGDDSLFNMAIADVGQVVFVFTVYKALLGRRRGLSAGQCAREMLLSPIFASILVGILVGVTGLGALIARSPLGDPVDAIVSFISAPTACVILFVVGYSMTFSRGSLLAAGKAALARIVIMAALFFASLFALRAVVQVSDGLMWALALMFSLPGPFVLPVFVRGKEEEEYVSTCLSLYTLVSIALFTLVSVLAM